jgi:hypothetical protein
MGLVRGCGRESHGHARMRVTLDWASMPCTTANAACSRPMQGGPRNSVSRVEGGLCLAAHSVPAASNPTTHRHSCAQGNKNAWQAEPAAHQTVIDCMKLSNRSVKLQPLKNATSTRPWCSPFLGWLGRRQPAVRGTCTCMHCTKHEHGWHWSELQQALLQAARRTHPRCQATRSPPTAPQNPSPARAAG